jgi:hypothetical protein
MTLLRAINAPLGTRIDNLVNSSNPGLSLNAATAQQSSTRRTAKWRGKKLFLLSI